jgi:hypothetical protein
MGKQKKYILDVHEEIDYVVFGISTPFADYRLAWELNNKFEYQLEKANEPVVLYDRKTKQQKKFHQFLFDNEENLTKIHLLKNKQGTQIVNRDHILMDYFLILIQNYSIDTNVFLTKLRNINGIVAAFKVESDNFDFIDEMNC